MASKAVGSSFGVARSANVIAVKCWNVDREAYLSDIVAGISYIMFEAMESKRPSVANFSWHCRSTPALVKAAASAIAAGVHIVAAAGNSHTEVFNFPCDGE